MNKHLNLICYILVLLSALLLLNWVKSTPDSAYQIMLYPHKRAAEIFYHSTYYYYEGIGYTNTSSVYAIGRECMGYNFILILYAMNACTYVRYFTGIRKLLWLITSFVSALFIGIVASSMRIIASIPFVRHENFHLIHLGIGITVYLIVLMIDYTGLNKLFGRDSL